MSTNVIDYFATLGKRQGPLVPKSFRPIWEESKKEISAGELWNSAITDIAVIFIDKGETLPDDTWELLSETISGYSAAFNIGEPTKSSGTFVIRRRKHSKRLDHICDVAFVPRNERLPDGFEVVSSSISGILTGDFTLCSKGFINP